MRNAFPPVVRIMVLFFVAALVVSAAAREPADTPHGPITASCDACHDMKTGGLREKPSFSHDTTRFPLVGQHRSQTCAACHPKLRFGGTSRECIRCHEDIHNGERGRDCSRCHEPTSFLRVDDFTGFHETTRFPLSGAHRAASCADCHLRSGKEIWKGLNTACVSCHLAQYRATSSPSHATAGFNTDCSRCHTPAGGFTGSFDHDTTAFPLTGAHRGASCASCHDSGVYRGLHSACADCHIGDYRKATEPDHSAASFSTTCRDCHVTSAWIPSSYDHSRSGFVLDGAHRTTSCGSCHVNNVYSGIPATCESCHTDDYLRTTNPSHTKLGFSRSCETCHTTGSWQSASLFSHTAVFPLTGAHAGASCSSCHTAQVSGKPQSDCWSCHSAKYTSAKDHAVSQFPKDCAQCHTTAAWSPSTFTHNRFKIYSGEHKGKWRSCTDCHTVPGDYSVYSCAKCHSDGRDD